MKKEIRDNICQVFDRSDGTCINPYSKRRLLECEEYKQLQAELDILKEFARKVIKGYVWGFDGEGIEEIAEKLGLIKSIVVTEKYVDEESGIEVGDTIFVFSDILKEPEKGK